MKGQKAFGAVMAALMVAGLCLAAARPVAADSGPVNQITIRGQPANNNQIIVESVTAAQDGWIIIYTDPCFSRCAIVGYAPVHRGLNTNFTVNVDSSLAEPAPTLWARLHADYGRPGNPPEWPGPDVPIWQNGVPVMVAFATREEPLPRPAPTRLPAGPGYAKLEADWRIFNWRKSETPGELIGTMQVFASGGNGRYTYEFIGTRTVDTFDFRWRACSALVESLHVSSGDGQKLVLPIWRDDLPCPKRWPGQDEDCDDCNCDCPCACGCDCDCL